MGVLFWYWLSIGFTRFVCVVRCSVGMFGILFSCDLGLLFCQARLFDVVVGSSAWTCLIILCIVGACCVLCALRCGFY